MPSEGEFRVYLESESGLSKSTAAIPTTPPRRRRATIPPKQKPAAPSSNTSTPSRACQGPSTSMIADQLDAGRILDQYIHTHILGYRLRISWSDAPWTPPAYSTDMTQAFRLVERMRSFISERVKGRRHARPALRAASC